jgi:hypothetical protein
VDERTGKHKYLEGWSDSRVASDTNTTVKQVQAVRYELGYKQAPYKSIVSELIDKHNELVDFLDKAYGGVDLDVFKIAPRPATTKPADVAGQKE